MLNDDLTTQIALLYLRILRRALPRGIPRTASGGARLAKTLGLTVVTKALPSRKGSYLVDDTIFVAEGLPSADRLIRILHECIEALTQTDIPGLIDDDLLILLPTRITQADRHQIAARAHQLAAAEMCLTTPPGSSFTWRDWLHIAQPADKLAYSKPTVPIETTNPFDDACT